MARKGSFVPTQNPFIRDVALWRASKSDRSRVQVRAAFLKELVEVASVDILPNWTLGGEHLLTGPSMGFRFQAQPDPDAEELERLFELGVDADEVDGVRQAVHEWVGARRSYAAGESASDSDLGHSASWGSGDPQCVYMARGWSENHSVRDFAKAIRIGFSGIRREIEERLEAADLSGADFPQRESFWRASLSICDAGIRLGERYAACARTLAEDATDPNERDRLTNMAEACARVPAEGARTFFEAVQALWLTHILTCGEDCINANSIGRLDQILYPYYAADLAEGRLTREDAVEIMAEFACKLYLDYDVQAITLGGLDREGNDAVNELSYIILEATRVVDFVRDVSVRLHSESPPEFVRVASGLIARGGGIPFIFNDDCFVKALSDRGIALDDARDYAPIGCIELTVPGRTSPHAVSGWFNSTKCLELALFNGVEPRTGEQLGPQTGELADFTDYDSFFEAYCEQVEFFAKRMVYGCNRGELMQREFGPLPCLSTLTDDCIPRGRDITDRGPVYNYHSVCFMGNANTADSLMAIKKLVFEEQKLEASRLLDALKRDFEGDEALRQLLLHSAPKYGNSDPEVDAIAAQVSEHFIALMDRMYSPLDGRYFVHLFTFKLNLPFGQAVGATPDGRRAGEPLAYSLSAHQGRDQEGVTAMLNSLSKLPHDQAGGATAAIIDLDPKLVAGEAGIDRLAQIIETAIRMRIGQLQFNVTTVERLRQAQQDPEHYGNIPVRVAGYSQMFKLIPPDLQEHIIARTKHRA